MKSNHQILGSVRRYARGLALGAFALALVIPAAAASSESLTDCNPTTELLCPTGPRGVIQLPATGSDEDVIRRLELERGKSAILRTEYNVKRVTVGDPAVADVAVLGSRHIQLVAKTIGDTNVSLWDSNSNVQVVIHVHVGAPYFQLAGELRRVLNNETITVDSAGKAVVLRGNVSSVSAMDQALRVAYAFFSDEDKPEEKVLNLLQVGGDHQVVIEIKIAEMKRTLRRNLGTNFQYSWAGGGDAFQLFGFMRNLTELGDASVGSSTTLLSNRVNLVGRIFNGADHNLDYFLELLEEDSLVKILAEPSLVARSGEQADFLVGGEVPIPIAQGAFGQITIEFKRFGVGVEFTPTVTDSGRIHMLIAPEVSEPDFTLGASLAGTVVPGFRTRRASTGVELMDGQSFAIAGLLRDDVRAVAAKYPVLGDIPVLGGLFRSSEYLNEETELVLIVTPHLVKPLRPGKPTLPTDHYVKPSGYEFYVLGRLEGREAPSEPGQTTAQAPERGLMGDVGHRLSIPQANGGSF